MFPFGFQCFGLVVFDVYFGLWTFWRLPSVIDNICFMFPSVTFLYVSFCAHYVSSLHNSQTPQFSTSPYLLIFSLMFSVPLISHPDPSEHLVYIFLEPVLDTLELILLDLTRTLPRFPWTLSFRLGSSHLRLLTSSPVFPTHVLVRTVDNCLSDSSLCLPLGMVRSGQTQS